jgi:hypothetical protein
VVLCEVSGGWSGGESPDAIGYSRHIGAGGEVVGTDLGWHYFDNKGRQPQTFANLKPGQLPPWCHPIYSDEIVRTVVVEAKATLADFYADRRKPFRLAPEEGMGSERYYLCPEGLIDPAKHTLPEGWGLLYTVGNGAAYRRPKKVRPSQTFWPKAHARELMLLVKWASIVEMATGKAPGAVWPSGWKKKLVERIRGVRKAWRKTTAT